MKSICVYSSSSAVIDQAYFDVASDLGREIGKRGYALVFGGGNFGLMGAMARAVHEVEGKVVGVVPEFMMPHKVAYEQSDELIIARDMRHRKAIMDKRANAFVALPGGFGTLEELLEILTLKQLNQHNKPLVILNTLGYYDNLIALFEQMYKQKFAKELCRDYYHVAKDAKDTCDYIENYVPRQIDRKWFKTGSN